MKAFFKENNKIIINSMDYTEALVGKQFLQDLAGKALYAEQRNDINDDFDGLVLTIGGTPTAGDIQVTPSKEAQEIDAPEGLGFARVLVDPVTSSIDDNITPYYIRKGVNILGVTGEITPVPNNDAGFYYNLGGECTTEADLLYAPGPSYWEAWLAFAETFGDTASVVISATNMDRFFIINRTSDNSADIVGEDMAYTLEIEEDQQTGEKTVVVTPIE